MFKELLKDMMKTDEGKKQKILLNVFILMVITIFFMGVMLIG